MRDLSFLLESLLTLLRLCLGIDFLAGWAGEEEGKGWSVGFSIHPDDAGPEGKSWRVGEEVTTSKAAAAASLLALLRCVWNTTKYTTRHLRLSLFFSPSIVAVGEREGGAQIACSIDRFVSLSFSASYSSLSFPFSSLIA